MRKLALIATFCLACVADAAWALGLGSIEVYSSLNQPLRAEIPLFSVKPGDRDAITVQIAPNSAFERTGIEHASFLDDLRFRVVQGASADQAIVQVTSVQPVREPFLAMLVEISWPEGRLVREFTVLLDPPVLQSGQSSRRPASDFDEPSSGVVRFGQTYEQPRGTRAAGGGTYGPVREQETLWSIALARRPDDSISMDQMMQAIYQANPEAFDGSISRIRAGSMLRIPTADEIRGTDPSQARREVREERRASRAGSTMDDVAPAPVAPTPTPQTAPTGEPQGELKLSPPTEAPAIETAPGDTTAAPEGETSASTASPATPAAAPRSSAPIEVRDNSAKAIELLTAHANEYSARQAASDQLTAETAQAATPAEAPKVAVPAAEQAPTPPAPTPPAPEAAAPATTSPFVDEPATAETAVPPIATQPPPATEAPPTSVDVSSDAGKPPSQQVDEVDASLPDAGDSGGFNPLMLGLGAAAILLLAVGASRFRKYRAARSSVQIAPIVLSQAGDMAEPVFGDTQETPASTTQRMADTQRTTPEPPVARTLETTLQRSLPPEQTTKQFMAVSTPQPTPAMPAMVGEAAVPSSDPYADALGEVDIHIAYGLYDEAARLLQEPLAKSPERKDLHIKLLEVYFSANMPAEFEAQAKKMQAIVAGSTDPEWEKVCIMGRQLCPESTLFGTGGAGTGIGTTADLDITSMLGGVQALPIPPAATPVAATPAASSTATPSLGLDLSGFELGLNTPPSSPEPQTSKPPTPATSATPEAAATDSANTLDFNLDDFKLDAVPATPIQPTAATADTSDTLDIDLTDFDIGTPAAPATKTTGGTVVDDQSMDDLLSPDLEVGEGQADTRLDLARAYMDMGEPDMAKSLLQEVIAQGNANQKREAQDLLGRLGTP